ncbi:MAG: nicotinamide mononucleotide transporter [Spirochaetales bacterium]|nr:nicotinamide mononucleotide transporter [Spirochaetales bacterium]
MDLVLQIWGGGFYLLNKVLFALAEGKGEGNDRFLKLTGWAVYILGVPAWVIILLGKQNWIAASIEAGGLPAMFLGFYSVYGRFSEPPKILDRVAGLFTYLALIVGSGYSLWENRGITSLSQLLEIGVMFGFLFGSFLLARKDRRGWLFFIVMNGCMAVLMFLQGKPLLTVQQLVSLAFVVYGFGASGRAIRE